MIKRHGNVALVQHIRAFQTPSLIGADYDGVADAHNMVVVVAKKYDEGRHGGASEPTGPTGPRATAELTEAADMAVLFFQVACANSFSVNA